MPKEEMKQVPVDPNRPERPIKLIVKAVNYLVDEMARLKALASDAVECRSPVSGAVLLAEIERRLDLYRQRGLEALIQITGDLVREYDTPEGPSDAEAQAD